MAADMLRVSVNTIANYERRGKLHPRYGYRPDSRGIEHRVAIYDPNELIQLPHPAQRPPAAREPGEIAARAFEHFDQGMNVREVVKALRETPDHVRTLHESWLDTGGAELMINEAAKAAFEKLLGPFASVTDLLELVESRLKENSA